MGGRIAESVGSKFTSQLHLYLPKVQSSMNEFKGFKEKVEMKWAQTEMDGGEGG